MKEDSEIKEGVEANRKIYQDGIIVCDDSGVILIKRDQITAETYNRLAMIELQEDIWSFCINTLKWSTYDTVCLKKYLIHPEVLPEALRKKVESIPFQK